MINVDRMARTERRQLIEGMKIYIRYSKGMDTHEYHHFLYLIHDAEMDNCSVTSIRNCINYFILTFNDKIKQYKASE